MSRLSVNAMPAERFVGCRFAETFESSAKVQSNEGTIVGTPVIDFGATFNGSTDKITYPTVNDVKSVSFWLELTTTTEDVLKLSSTHSITVSGGTLSANGFTSPTIRINNSITTTITTARSFVTVTTGTAFDADDMQIGYVSSWGDFWMDRCFLWSNELGASEHSGYYLHSLFNYRNQAALDLPMQNAQDDPGNDRTLDVSRNLLHASYTPGATQPTKGTKRGYIFDNADHFDVGDHSELDFGAVGTIACVTKLTSMPAASSWGIIYRKGNWETGRDGYSLYITQSVDRITATIASASTAKTLTFTPASSLIGRTVTFVHTWNLFDNNLYIDGILVDTNSSLVATPSGQVFHIGNPDSNRSAIGCICCLQAYSSFFNPIQVADYHISMLKKVNDE